MNIPDFDDKDLVIIAVFLICMAALIMLKVDSVPIISNALSGLFGVAVGRATKPGASS